MIGEQEASEFGRLIRERRKAMGLKQDDLALVAGVGRRYLIELEGGKPTSRIGPALVIAKALKIEFLPAGHGPNESPGDLPDPEF